MGKKNNKKIQSFEALDKAFKESEFDTFVRGDSIERSRILSAYGLEYQKKYYGKYKKDTNTVIITGRNNPFTKKPLVAKLVDKKLSITDNSTIQVILTAFKSKDGLTPNNIFAGRLVEVQNQPSKRHEVDGLPVYSKKEVEEKQKKREQELREQDKRKKAAKQAIIELRHQRELERQERKKRQAEAKKKERLEEKLRQETIQRERVKKAREEAERNRKEQIRKHQEERMALEKRNSEIQTILTERRIINLIHFTRTDNLPSIIKYGVLPKNELIYRKVSYAFNDESRYDNQWDCTSLSIEYPNTRLLRSYRVEHPEAHWAVIELKTDLLFNHKCYFLEYNAATGMISKRIKWCQDVDSLRRMFSESLIINTTKGEQKFKRANMRNRYPYLPTTDQAEILVTGKISPKHIRSVYFMTEEDARRYWEILNNNGINCFVNRDIFLYDRESFRGFKVR